MCWKDTSDSGTIADEPLTQHITPDTPILVDYGRNHSVPRGGVIVLYSESSRHRLSSAILGTTMSRALNGTIARGIEDRHNGTQIGYMLMERPLFDPNMTSKSLGQDSLLAEIPEGLRPAVDPASLLPSSNKSCGTIGDAPPSCLVIVAVSIDHVDEKLAFNIVQVRRCLLLRPRSNEHSLPSHYNQSANPSYNTPGGNVCNDFIAELLCLVWLTAFVRNPSSVYVVYQPPQIFDECREMLFGIDGPPVTMSYHSSMISTLEYRSDGPPTTKTMDFADLPCPPSEVAKMYNSGVPYFPVLVSTFDTRWNRINNTDGSIVAPICDIAAIRDPPVHAYRVEKISAIENDNNGIL